MSDTASVCPSGARRAGIPSTAEDREVRELQRSGRLLSVRVLLRKREFWARGAAATHGRDGWSSRADLGPLSCHTHPRPWAGKSWKNKGDPWQSAAAIITGHRWKTKLFSHHFSLTHLGHPREGAGICSLTPWQPCTSLEHPELDVKLDPEQINHPS